MRLPATLLAAASVLVVAAIAAEVGGDRLAQGLAAWGYAFGTFTLTFGHVFLTTSWDLLLWPLMVLATLAAIRHDPRWWLLAGTLVGLSTYNKWLVVLLVAALLGGLLLAGPRRVLLSPWLLGAAAWAVLLSVPNLVWQLRHGLPQLEMGRALAAENAADVRVAVLPILLVAIGPLLVAFVVAGAVHCWRRRDLRFLPVALVILVALTLAGGSQVYFPYGLLAAVFAVGCRPVAAFARRSRGRYGLVLGLVAVHVAVNAVLSLPVLPERALGAAGLSGINQAVGDQVGWPRYVRQVDAVLDEALRRDPATVVLATNYGEAGALHRLSRHPAVPVVSGHNALHGLGGPPAGTRTVVVVGDQLDDVRADFADCTVRAELDNGSGVDNEEQGEPVAICRDPQRSWAELWPELRHLG